jgi:hypothetical protein
MTPHPSGQYTSNRSSLSVMLHSLSCSVSRVMVFEVNGHGDAAEWAYLKCYFYENPGCGLNQTGLLTTSTLVRCIGTSMCLSLDVVCSCIKNPFSLNDQTS